MKTKKASAGTPAGNKLQIKSYRGIPKMSTTNLKESIGEILLFGDKRQKSYWPLLDVMLRQYVCLRISQNGYCSGLDSTGANKSS